MYAQISPFYNTRTHKNTQIHTHLRGVHDSSACSEQRCTLAVGERHDEPHSIL